MRTSPRITASAAAPAAPAAASQRLTFARRRLRLGITGVGASVVMSVVWLALLLSGAVAFATPWGDDTSSLGIAIGAASLVLVVFAVHAAFVLPVEAYGGLVAVRERPARLAWCRSWLRGVLAQGALLATAAFSMALGGVTMGWFGAVASVAAVGTMLLAAQGPLARLVARLPVRPLDSELETLALQNGIRPESARVVDTTTEAFVGGWIGLGKPTLWIPRHWTRPEHRSLLAVQFNRRQAQYVHRSRARALWRAVAWPTAGVALLVPMLPWTWTDPTLWLAVPAAMTLWTFLAVLLLPAASRPAVYGADAVAASRLGVAPVTAALRQLDVWQDDEPERSPGVEFIFHPVPSQGNRERALRRATRPAFGGGHQQTRLTLFVSLAGLGLLGRMVHCNIGSPGLWVVYPGD